MRLGVADLAVGNLIFTAGAAAAGGRAAAGRHAADAQARSFRCRTTASMRSRCFRCWSTRRSRSGCSTRSRACSSRAATAVITVRNRYSRYGWYYFRALTREQVPNQGPFVPLVGARSCARWRPRASRSSARPASRLAPTAMDKIIEGGAALRRARLRAAGRRRSRDDRQRAARPERLKTASPIRRS